MALVYPEREGETMGVGFNPKHEWKYLRGMRPDECAVFKWYVFAMNDWKIFSVMLTSLNSFDSVDDGSVARFTPHTAFEDPTTPADAPHRESIELRAMVFYD